MNNNNTSSGFHIVADFEEVENKAFLLEMESVKDYLKELIEKNGLSVRGVTAIDFKQSSDDQIGYSICFVLAESHFSIHTWPEENKANLDLYCCNLTKDNSTNASAIIDHLQIFFECKSPTVQTLLRR